MPSRILEAPRPPSSSRKSKLSSSLSKTPKREPPSWRSRDEDDIDSDDSDSNMHMTPVASSAYLQSLDDDDDDDDENAPLPSDRRKVSFSRDTLFRDGYTANQAGMNSTTTDTDADEDCESSDDEDMMDGLPVIHVEARLRSDSMLLYTHAMRVVKSCLQNNYNDLRAGFEVPKGVWGEVDVLRNEMERIYVSEAGEGDEPVNVQAANFEVHIYQASATGAVELGDGDIEDMDQDDDDEKTSTAMVHSLPCAEFESLWDNLIYDDNIKPNLLRYISSSMMFSENDVDHKVISWNRMVLLHGPPGTGKTSLCRALAQKLAIRMSDTFTSGRLVEINSHSLFSKWFSESGKLVQKLFDAVHEMIANEEQLVVVMIDEVESLTSAREASGEPSDALRVVNALLTQLDKLKAHKNVLVMTTSNLAGKIDPAFLDRADVKQYVGLPPAGAIYWMLKSCLTELGRRDIAVGHEYLLDWTAVGSAESEKYASKRRERGRQVSIDLMKLAQTCQTYGFSGRFLRKVPLIAHAKYLGSQARIDRWVTALGKAVEDEHRSRGLLGGVKTEE